MCEWCDLEVETLEELPGKSVRGFGVPEKVLLSIHDFRKTPRLPKRVSCLPGAGVDAIKIAAMAQTIADSVRLLRVCRKIETSGGGADGRGRIAGANPGAARRKCAGVCAGGAATAPGQVGLRELKDLYRAHELTKQTGVFGVIGHPIGHSLSPLMHNTGILASKGGCRVSAVSGGEAWRFLKAMLRFWR